MEKITFNSNQTPSPGVENELALVDTETMALTKRIQKIIARFPESVQGRIKPEVMQCYLEINSKTCANIPDFAYNLLEKALAVQGIADQLRSGLIGRTPTSSTPALSTRSGKSGVMSAPITTSAPWKSGSATSRGALRMPGSFLSGPSPGRQFIRPN
jgi:hypothetical protein